MTQKMLTRRGFLGAAAGAAIVPSLGNRNDSKAAVITESAFINRDGYTPTAHFYRQQLRYVPRITPVFWALRLYGMVEKPLTIIHEQLQTFEKTSLPCTVACISSGAKSSMVGHALWTGVPMASLLEQVSPKSEATYAQLYGTDGYTTYVETEKLANAVLAYEMNGEPLPQEHGYPARLIIPGLYGYKMPKWIQRIEFTNSPKPGFWEERGWSASGEMQTSSTIFSPYHLQSVSDIVSLNGAAYAGARTITTVEISVNDSPWMPTAIAESEPYSWIPWQIDWTPPAPGDYLIKVRASDNSGFTQLEDAPTFPNGPTAIRNIVVRVTE
jgi:DMSO/TMAO reductase YedYZ molybdopterin-dependent catalytic subunit